MFFVASIPDWLVQFREDDGDHSLAAAYLESVADEIGVFWADVRGEFLEDGAVEGFEDSLAVGRGLEETEECAWVFALLHDEKERFVRECFEAGHGCSLCRWLE